MQTEALETLVNNHYKGLIAALASRIQDTVEANIRGWLSNEFKNQLDHYDVAFNNSQSDEWNDASRRFSENFIEEYLERHDYINKNNIDKHIENYIENSNICTEDNFDDSVREWMSNNFDISDYDIDETVKNVVQGLDFTVEVS